jgi:DNA-binding CsgD family transcriptional regulator
MGGHGSGRRSPSYSKFLNTAKWGWGNIAELEMLILQSMAEGAEPKQIMYAMGLTRRQLVNKLFRLRQQLACKNDMDMICSGMRKGFLR